MTEVFGNGWVEANCFDGKQRRCRIRGSMRKPKVYMSHRQWIEIMYIINYHYRAVQVQSPCRCGLTMATLF